MAAPEEIGMFAFADRDHVTEVVTAAGWAPPRFEKLDMDLDIAAGRGLEGLWFSQPKLAPSTVGCATSQQRSSLPPSPLFARRLHPMRTVRECDCPARCG